MRCQCCCPTPNPVSASSAFIPTHTTQADRSMLTLAARSSGTEFTVDPGTEARIIGFACGVTASSASSWWTRPPPPPSVTWLSVHPRDAAPTDVADGIVARTEVRLETRGAPPAATYIAVIECIGLTPLIASPLPAATSSLCRPCSRRRLHPTASITDATSRRHSAAALPRTAPTIAAVDTPPDPPESLLEGRATPVGVPACSVRDMPEAGAPEYPARAPANAASIVPLPPLDIGATRARSVFCTAVGRVRAPLAALHTTAYNIERPSTHSCDSFPPRRCMIPPAAHLNRHRDGGGRRGRRLLCASLTLTACTHCRARARLNVHRCVGSHLRGRAGSSRVDTGDRDSREGQLEQARKGEAQKDPDGGYGNSCRGDTAAAQSHQHGDLRKRRVGIKGQQEHV